MTTKATAHTKENLMNKRTEDTGDEGVLAVSYPNMALVKYWGKRDETLILPVASSLSMTLDIFPTTTRVTLTPAADADALVLNGCHATLPAHLRVRRFLDLVRSMTGRTEPALVETNNTVPTGSGLASSASGFAALAAAASVSYGLTLDQRALSRLARRGSGSACRSVFGGFVIWHAGTGLGSDGDQSSYAEPIRSDFDPALVIAMVDTTPKTMSSRTAMRQTMATSRLYASWAAGNAADLKQMCDAVTDANLAAAGRIAEHNALGMHAAMLAARPPIRYLSPHSLAVLDRVEALRADGIPAYATIDAGPNVAVLCSRSDSASVVAALREVGDFISTHVAHRGPAVNSSCGSRS
jgi:diphosphomevalonate decarboxylase